MDYILSWRRDPMAIIKSLEKSYMLKWVDTLGNYLGGNV
jgi:hypothetical protein